MQVVKRAPLVKQRRVGRVQVLWRIGCATIEDAPAKGDHPAAHVLDGQHQTATKAVVRFLALNRDPQAGFLQQAFRKLRKRRLERLPPFRRIAEAEPLHRPCRKPARCQIAAGLNPIRSVQGAHEEVLRRFHDIVQGILLFGLLRRARIGGGDFHPGLGRQFLHRIHEGQPALVGHPADHVTMRPAAEAVVEALLVVDREAGRLLVMKRATGLELMPCLDEPRRPRNHAGERDAAAQFIKPLGGEGHGRRKMSRLRSTRMDVRAGTGENGLLTTPVRVERSRDTKCALNLTLPSPARSLCPCRAGCRGGPSVRR